VRIWAAGSLVDEGVRATDSHPTHMTAPPGKPSRRAPEDPPDPATEDGEDYLDDLAIDRPEVMMAAGPVDWRKAAAVGVVACVVVGLLESVNDYVLRWIEGSPRGWLFVTREQMPWWLLWSVFLPAVLWLARRFRFDDARWRRSAAVHAGMGLLIALAHGVTYAVGFHYAAPGATPVTLGAHVRLFLMRYLFMDIMTYSAAVGVYYAFEYFSGFRRSALAAARSEAQAATLQLNLAEARIHALRMELNPHFLFNALNAVAGLVCKRSHEAAIDMLDQLGELLRTTLNRNMPAEVPLAEELELLRRYLSIEQVRFGDRLRVTWDVDPETHAALVPPLILQPLLENALRHGIARRPGSAMVRISARRAGLHLELAVRDTGEGLASHGRPPREGIGLSNIRARLAEMYGRDATQVELTDVPGGGARARLMIPYHLTAGSTDVARRA
jgi:two-component system, LytTR family, sensor kinase